MYNVFVHATIQSIGMPMEQGLRRAGVYTGSGRLVLQSRQRRPPDRSLVDDMHDPNLIQCPHCGQPYTIAVGDVEQWLGGTHLCRHCERLFVVERPAGEFRTAARGRVQPLSYAPVVSAMRQDGVSVAALASGIAGLIVPVLPAAAAVLLGVMGIRRTATPGIAGRRSALAGLILGLIGLLITPALYYLLLDWRSAPVPPARTYTSPSWAFYTDDDGETFFVDYLGRSTPFEHEGQQAVSAHVFTCDGGWTEFVGYLERDAPPQEPDQFEFDDLWFLPDTELRRPGPDQQWVDSRTADAEAIRTVNCPDGTPALPVLP